MGAASTRPAGRDPVVDGRGNRVPQIAPEHEIAQLADRLLAFCRREPATVEASNEHSSPSS
jgi:hypothetical protein